MASILFIDDDPSSLEILGKAAEILGHQAVLLNEPGRARETARQIQPDLILIDLMMPTVDGWEVLNSLKSAQDLASIPVVILSAGAGRDEAERADHSGAQAYLSKPVSLADLQGIITKFIPPDAYL